MSKRIIIFVLLVSPLSAVATMADAATDSAPTTARIIDATGDRMPDHTQAPKYPRVARRDRIEGEVQVCFEIDRKGRPRKVAVRRSTHRLFEKVSIKAVKTSSFRAIPKGETVPQVKSCRTFIYSLEPAVDDS